MEQIFRVLEAQIYLVLHQQLVQMFNQVAERLQFHHQRLLQQLDGRLSPQVVQEIRVAHGQLLQQLELRLLEIHGQLLMSLGRLLNLLRARLTR